MGNSEQLKRGGKLVTELDICGLLLRGDKAKDAPLETGDVPYFPPVGAQVAVVGSVHLPEIYDLIAGAATGLTLGIMFAPAARRPG
jgi:polysaccharide export outer membrane protein